MTLIYPYNFSVFLNDDVIYLASFTIMNGEKRILIGQKKMKCTPISTENTTEAQAESSPPEEAPGK